MRKEVNSGVEKTTQQGALCSVIKYFSGDQIKKTEMSRAGSRYGGEERCIQDFIGET
jgi:hypothetical protein